jgi:LacI family transcriptional regulator
VPVAELARRSRIEGVDSVLAADRAGAAAAVAHLVGLGHRRIALVCGPAALSTARERLAGYREALAAAGLAEDPSLVRLGTFRRPFGYDAALSLLTLPMPPTAILAASSELLIGALRAAHGHGVAIPQALSVVGFGDPDWFGVAHPAVTTVALPMAEMAAAAANQLLRRIEEERRSPRRDGPPMAAAGGPGARTGVHLHFEAPLLARGTTAPPAAPGTRGRRRGAGATAVPLPAGTG